ncbi:MAG: cadherin-like beta sandwich domain-containing protein, partial [Bacilli bacterium]
GNTKTYTIEVIKVDRRSNNTNLKELTIEGVDIEFNKDKLEYNIEVDYSLKRLDINAIAEHVKSVVAIEDSNLEVGQNKIIIKVKAENGDTKDYILNVTRKSEVKKDITKNEEETSNNSRLLLIILIIATISFLLYLIFEDNDKEPKYNLKEKETKKDTKQQNNNNNDNINNKKKNKK